MKNSKDNMRENKKYRNNFFLYIFDFILYYLLLYFIK